MLESAVEPLAVGEVPADCRISEFVERLHREFDAAPEFGIPYGSLPMVVKEAVSSYNPSQLSFKEVSNGFDAQGVETIYDTLPEGLIDLPSAVRKHGINRATLRSWIEKGYLECYGRLRGRAPGGGYLLISERALLICKNSPKPKGGRPKQPIST